MLWKNHTVVLLIIFTVDNPADILKGIMTANKQPTLLSRWQAKQFCPQATITDTVLQGMETYKVHSDSLQKFLKQNITHLYVDPQSDRHCKGEATILSLHEIIVQCKINQV